jgi:hypothetical protein
MSIKLNSKYLEQDLRLLDPLARDDWAHDMYSMSMITSNARNSLLFLGVQFVPHQRAGKIDSPYISIQKLKLLIA